MSLIHVSPQAKQAVLHHLTRPGRSHIVPVRETLAEIRRDMPLLVDSDADLHDRIIVDAASLGYIVLLDQETRDAASSQNYLGSLRQHERLDVARDRHESRGQFRSVAGVEKMTRRGRTG